MPFKNTADLHNLNRQEEGSHYQRMSSSPTELSGPCFQTSVIVPPAATTATHGPPSDASSVPALPAPDYCTPAMVQQMLISTLSAMGFQGKTSTKLWYVDSGASNHMTNNPTALCHVYTGQSAIQTASGSSLPIAAFGDASSQFTNVFLAPQVSTNLISVGQLVDNNCVVHFSSDGYVMQDQVTGHRSRRDLKWGACFLYFCLFQCLLQFLLLRLLLVIMFQILVW